MNLPKPPAVYNQRDMMEARKLIVTTFAQTHSRQTNLEISVDQSLIMTSPDGTRWAVTIDNAGAFTSTAI